MNDEFWDALDELVKNSDIVIDRPKGTTHPRFPDFVYKVDYGYLKETTSMDGGGIDVWVGTDEKKIDAIICIVDLMKKDSEIKILIGCTEEEKQIIYQTHNETKYMLKPYVYLLFFALTSRNKGYFYSPPTTLSSSLAEVRFAFLVA